MSSKELKWYVRSFPGVFKINGVIAILTVSDVFTWGFYSILIILTGVYLAEKLGVHAPQFVGIGTGLYLFVRAVSQLPLGKLIDSVKRDTDEILLLSAGNVCMGMPFLFYPLIRTPQDYYLLQMMFGLGTSMNLVSWRKLFAKNLEKNSEGSEYGLYETVMSGMGMIIAFIAGSLANIGPEFFDYVFVGIGIIMILSSFSVLFVFKVRNRKRFD